MREAGAARQNAKRGANSRGHRHRLLSLSMALLFALCSLPIPKVALAVQTATIQPGPTDGIDTFVWADNPDLNRGSTTYMYVRTLSFGETWGCAVALIKFDLSSLVGVTITSATLYLYESNAGWYNRGTVYAHRILSANSDWSESSTWNHKVGSSHWAGDVGGDHGTDAGCTQSGVDWDATPLGSVDCGNLDLPLGYEFSMTWDLGEFQEMIGNNYGFVLYSTEALGTWPYSSDEATYTSWRPKLVVQYTSDSGWQIGYDKRIKMTIDHNDVTSTLTNFPVLVYLSTTSGRGTPQDDLSCVFNELTSDANRKKISVTTSDGTTECYVEIEKWDNANKKAWLWVKVPSVSSVSDTVLYLYYDKDHADNTAYVGDVDSTVAQNVWDSNFKGVWHLSQMSGGSGAIKDSTSNNNDGTNINSPTFGATGKIDSAIEFDGTSPYDYIKVSDSAGLRGMAQLTIECWANLQTKEAWNRLLEKADDTSSNSNQEYLFILDDSADQKMGVDVLTTSGSSYVLSDSAFPTNQWVYVVGRYNGATVNLYINAVVQADSDANSGNIRNVANPLAIGAGTYHVGDAIDGTMDEVRISNTARSPAWITASYESGRDHLIDFGGEEPGTTLLTYKNKYVVTSASAVTTTSTVLQDDTQAIQAFSLTASQTVLVIYQANSLHGDAMPVYGMQNAISVDGMDRANSWDAPTAANYATRNTVFWIGTLASGSHTIKGRFATGLSGQTATVSNRVLLIYILDGNAYLYLDSSTKSTTSTSSFIDDPAAQFTFTPSGSCKALILYNVANFYDALTQVEDKNGKKVAINVGGTDYAQAEKSTYMLYYSDSVFTAWAMQLSATSTTVKGRFACSIASTVTINRRQLGVLMFADTTLMDTYSSDTQTSTTQTSLQDDSLGFTKLYLRNTNAATGPTGKASPDSDYFPSTPSDKNTPKDMTTSKGTAQTSVSGSYNNGGANRMTMCRIFVGPALGAQTLTGSQANYKVGLGIIESSSSMNLYGRVFVYIWRPGSGNVKSITSSPVSCPTEHGASQERECIITFNGASGDFGIQAGDRIVVEIWWDIKNSGSTSYTATDYYDGTIEMSADGTAATDAAAFFSCPQTLYSAATIQRTTSEYRELLVVAMGTKRFSTTDSDYGMCYGIMIDSNDRANSRGTHTTGGVYASSVATAYAENLATGSHTIKGRFATNSGSSATKVDSRRIVALWLVCPPPAVPEFPLGALILAIPIVVMYLLWKCLIMPKRFVTSPK